MDEREEVERAAALRSFLRGRIDRIEVGPLSAYVPTPRRRRLAGVARASLAVGGTAIFLVAALVIGTQLGLRRAAAPEVTPPPFGLSPKYGVLTLTPDGFLVRSETDATTIRQVQATPASPDAIAVSSDGRWVAYWRPATMRSNELVLYDATTNAEPRPLLRLEGEYGRSLAWSDDGTGLAFTAVPSWPGPPAIMRLKVVDIRSGAATGSPREIAVAPDASTVLRPLTWIRETGTVSAVEGTSEGVATSYLIAGEDGQVKRFPLASGDQVVRMDDVVVDAQSRMLAYIVSFTCQDGSPGCTLVRFWALEDPQTAVGWQAEPGSTFVRARWRPFTRELVVVTRRADGEFLQTWDAARFGPSRSIGPLPPGTTLMRPDGRSIISVRFATGGGWLGALHQIDGAQSTQIDLGTGGVPTFSLTLDEREADRIARLPQVPPLLTEGEIVELVRKRHATDRIDHFSATLVRGSFPAAGTMPVWIVRATGEFQVITRGGPASQPPPVNCAFWAFNARNGRMVGTQLQQSDADCSGRASPAPSPPIDCGHVQVRFTGDREQGALDCVWSAYTGGQMSHLSVVVPTTEGDPIPAILLAVPGGHSFLMRDWRADQFSSAANRAIVTSWCATLSRRQWATDPSRYSFELSDCLGPSRTTSFP